MSQPIVRTLLNTDVGGFKPVVDYPGDNCCYLYDEYQFDWAGEREENHDIDQRRELICHNGHRTDIDVAALGWNNKVSSYYCGKNVWFDFCNGGVGSNCKGSQRFNSGAGHMKNFAIRYLGNQMSSAILGPYDPREVGAVTLFEDEDCSGASARFYWDPESLENGTFYNNEDLKYAGMRDNTLSSVMVPKGYTVELYRHAGFYGESNVIEGAYKDYGSEEMVC